MSRTYRRKNCEYEEARTSDWIWREDGTYYYVKGSKADIAKFHSDTNYWVWPGCGSVGKWGKKIFARETRFKNKELLDRSIREYNDKPMFIPYYHPYR